MLEGLPVWWGERQGSAAQGGPWLVRCHDGRVTLGIGGSKSGTEEGRDQSWALELCIGACVEGLEMGVGEAGVREPGRNSMKVFSGKRCWKM